MPSVDKGVQRELEMWKPNFQQSTLNCSRAVHAHTLLRAQSLVPGVSVLNMKPWPWGWVLLSKKLLGFFFFFFFPHNLHLDLERNPAIGPPTGWSNAWGWDMKPQSVFGFFRSKCEFRWSEEFSEQEMRCGWTCCKVAFHNVTPRQRNSHKSNFPIFGKGLYCYSSADFVCEFPCWPTFLITIFKAKNVKELAKTKPLIQLRKPFYFFRQTMW